MRGLFLSFAIGFVAFTNGAPTEEESKVYSKSFSYDNKDVIYAALPFWKNDLIYAVCEGSDATKKCKVYIESSNLDEHTVQSCNLDLKFTGASSHNVGLFNAGHSKAVIAIPNRVAQQFTLISVNLKGCQIKEATVDVTGLSEDPNKTPSFMVLPHEKDFDVIYHNKPLCQEYLCKATFDYEGKEIKAVARFPIKDLSLLRVESTNNSYLVSGIDEDSANVCLVHVKKNKSETLFSDKLAAVVLSTEENKLGYCSHAPQKLVCKQYDADGKTKKIEVNATTGHGRLFLFDMHNLEKGLLTLTVEDDVDRQTRNVFIVRYDEQGKQGKYVNVDLKCNRESGFLYPKLYKNSNGQYCASSVCIPSQGNESLQTLFHDKLTAVAMSTEENKLGYCSYSPQKLTRKQYEADGETKITEAEVKIGERQLQFVGMRNLEKGVCAVG